jgi:protein TonB
MRHLSFPRDRHRRRTDRSVGRRRAPGLPLFLLLSATLHALWLVAPGPSRPSLGAKEERALSVNLSAPPSPATAAAAAKQDNSVRLGVVTAAPPDRPVRTGSVTSAPAAGGAADQDRPNRGEIPDAGNPQAAAARIRARLLADLARYFSYPPLARQHGWQGTVRLGFRIEADGRLGRIHVARSSGYAVLDESAADALARLNRLAQAPAWLGGRALDLQLPVIYRLMER